jgi:hypothetical protein
MEEDEIAADDETLISSFCWKILELDGWMSSMSCAEEELSLSHAVNMIAMKANGVIENFR